MKCVFSLAKQFALTSSNETLIHKQLNNFPIVLSNMCKKKRVTHNSNYGVFVFGNSIPSFVIGAKIRSELRRLIFPILKNRN